MKRVEEESAVPLSLELLVPAECEVGAEQKSKLLQCLEPEQLQNL